MSDNEYKPLRIVDPMANAEKMVEVPVASDEVDLPGNDGYGGNDGIGKRKKKKDDNTYQSFFEHDFNLYEQIHYDGKNRFVSYNTVTGELGETSGVGKIFPLPLQRNEIDTVGLPENAINFYKQYEDANDAELDLLTEVEQFIYKYVDLDNSFRTFAACYVLLSWLYDRFYSIPYLRLLGDFGSGKSRALDVIGGLCYRSINVSGATSSAGIFRIIDRWRGTLILDEADFRNSDEATDVVRILNMGFERNRAVLRVNNDNTGIDHFSTFGPKLIASRKRFTDEALESRCISTITKQTNRTDIPFNFGKQFFEERNQLRKKLLMYRLRNWELIDPEIFNIDVDCEPRLKQISLPFFVLFSNNQELLNDFKKFIEGFQKELVEDRSQSLHGQVVGALFELFDLSGHKTERTVSDTSVTTVTGVTPSQIADRLDMKDVKPARVGNLLRSIGLKTRLAKIDGTVKRYVEYHGQRFKALRERYIPTPSNAGNDINTANRDSSVKDKAGF
jgi:hypothetical protein